MNKETLFCKERVLSELELAYLLVEQRKFIKILEKNHLVKSLNEEKFPYLNIKKEKKKHSNNLIENLIDYHHNYYTDTFKSVEEMKEKKIFYNDLMKKTFDYLQYICQEKPKSLDFKTRFAELELISPTEISDSLINTTHLVCVEAPYSIPDFITALESLQNKDRFSFLDLTSNLLENSANKENQKRLLIRTLCKEPLENSEQQINEEIKKLIKEELIDEQFLPKYTLVNLLQLQELNETDISFKTNKEDFSKCNTASLFLSQFEDIFKECGYKTAIDWIKHTGILIEEDRILGTDMATKSSSAVIKYVKELNKDLPQLVDDYKILGDAVFLVSDFFSKYEGLTSERIKSLINYFVNSKKGNELKSLVNNELPKEQVETIKELLPEEITNEDLIKAINRTSKCYEKCKLNVINNKIFTKKLKKVNKTDNIDDYLKRIGKIDAFVTEYIDFVNEQREQKINFFFSDFNLQNSLEFYIDFLNKDFLQFKRHFQSIGEILLKLPELQKRYSQFFDDNKLKSIMGYVIKKKRKDIIKGLLQNMASDERIKFTGLLIPNLEKVSTENIINILIESDKTYDFLKDVGSSIELLSTKIKQIPKNTDYNNILKIFSEEKKKFYSAVIGENVEIPEKLEYMVDNVIAAYYKKTGISEDVDIQPALKFIMSSYLRDGSEKTFEALREIEGNKKLRNKFKQQGVNIEAYEKGINRQYNVRTNGNELERLNERVQSEMEQIYDRLGQLEIEKEQLIELHHRGLIEQLKAVEKFIRNYDFTDETRDLKLEIKGHIQAVRSMNGTLKEREADVEFYVSTNPLEALHMGQYFHSCLSLCKNHGGSEAWASVVQVMDSNKNVIYVKSSDGRYIGRNRTALTDRGILCTKFYQNDNLYLDDAWINYLKDFADEVRQEVMIPTKFANSEMSNNLAQLAEKGEVVLEERTVYIEPAYFSAFYGDGLATEKLDDGRVRLEGEMYVIKISN